MATAQNGWAASANKLAIGVDSNFNVEGVRFPGGVKSGDVATVLGYVAEQFHRRVEPLVDGWCWGHSYRDVRGGTSLSNHSAGCAIDVNAPSHPLGRKNTFDSEQVTTIRQILAECLGVVRWGGTYTRPDEMHFEIIGDHARVAAAAVAIRAKASQASSDGAAVLKRGSSGEAVRQLQHVLNAWYPYLRLAVDGDYGPATEAGVKELQRRAGIKVDGIAGAMTFRVLGM